MGHRLGLDIGDEWTVWAVASVDTEGRRLESTGRVPTVVAPVPGSLTAGEEVPSATPGSVAGFVRLLGRSEPVMVAGVPYGVESLLAAMVSSAARSAVAHRPVPGFEYVVLAHPDGIDEYRLGLWRDAARLAGVPVVATVTASATLATETLAAHAATAPAGHERGAGAALVRVPSDTDPMPVGGVGVGEIAAGAAAAGAAGAVLWTVAGSGGGAVAAAAGQVAGPAGAPLAAGPAGTPLGSGPVGAPAGPAGAPMGPAGTPLSAPAGPAGTPLTPATAPVTTPVKAGGIPKLFGSAKATVAAAAVVVASVATVAVVAGQGDDSSSGVRPAGTTAAGGTAPGPSQGGSTAGAPDTTAVAPGGSVDVSSVLGEWMSCEPYLSGDGASSGTWTLVQVGDGLVDFVNVGRDHTTTDCSDDAAPTITATMHLRAMEQSSGGGIAGIRFEQLGDMECTDTAGGMACGLAAGSATGGSMVFGVDADGLLRWGDSFDAWFPPVATMQRKG